MFVNFEGDAVAHFIVPSQVSEALRDSQVKYQQLEETNSSLQSRLEELQVFQAYLH